MVSSQSREPWAGNATPSSADAASSNEATATAPELAAVPESVREAGTERQAALRALRNLEATEARLERNARREADELRAKLVEQLLPVLDNLERTIRAAQTRHGDPVMIEGVRMVQLQLEGVVRSYGAERIEATGQRFDPAAHDAISTVPVDDPDRSGVVVQQIEPGYRFAGRLLRPAKVVVGKLIAPAVGMPVWWR